MSRREEKDERALHSLITAYARLAVSIAGRFRHYGLPVGDLVRRYGGLSCRLQNVSTAAGSKIFYILVVDKVSNTRLYFMELVNCEDWNNICPKVAIL